MSFYPLVDTTNVTEIRQAEETVPVHPHSGSLAHQQLLRHKPPVAAVLAVVAVVAEDKILPLGHPPLTVDHRAIDIPVDPMRHIRQRLVQQQLLGTIRRQPGQQFLRLRHTIEVEHLVPVADKFTLHTDYALDVVDAGVLRIAKYDDIAMLRIIVADETGIQHRQSQTVVVLVDQDEVTDLQCRQHGAGRNLERLIQEGPQYQHHKEYREHGF